MSGGQTSLPIFPHGPDTAHLSSHSSHPLEHSFSDRLLRHPLFIGFSRLDFLDIVGVTPFDFKTYAQGHYIVRQYDPCEKVCLLLSGLVSIECEDPTRTFRLLEEIDCSAVLNPSRIYGLHTHYTHSCLAKGKVMVAWLDKVAFSHLLATYPAFRINFLNYLSSYIQNVEAAIWDPRKEDAATRFAAFVRHRCLRPIGKKVLHIKMEDLATEIGLTRLRVSHMLAQLKAQGLLTYTRGIISIYAIEHLPL